VSTRRGCTSAIADRDNYDGHPTAMAARSRRGLTSTTLPYFDDQVHFPDLRIEYEDSDGRRDHRDVEVLTINYVARTAPRQRDPASVVTADPSARIGGREGAAGGGSGGLGGLAEELLG